MNPSTGYSSGLNIVGLSWRKVWTVNQLLEKTPHGCYMGLRLRTDTTMIIMKTQSF